MTKEDISHADYALAMVCALPLELTAAKAMLDEIHTQLPSSSTQCSYTLGRIKGHNTVLACLPSGVPGTTSAAAIVSYIQSTFPNIRCGLMVGIGGGVPSKTADIRLGDVVVSKPTGISSGVAQYDLGKTISGGYFQQTGTLNQPPTILLTAIAQLEASEMMRRSDAISKSISHVLSQNPDMEASFSRPQGEDRLFEATYEHLEGNPSCIACDADKQISRTLRVSREPQIHYGIIASGNQVMKDGHTRDRIARRLNALCFEMEAAGIMNNLPCLVIRGICDYCDSHKNKQWQGYAALAAAAYAKLLLSVLPVTQTPKSEALPQAFWMVPFDQNPQFLGRESEIGRLENLILPENRTRKAAIAGLGGIGKTQIALELAYRIRDRDPNRSIFWIRSTNMEAVEKSFVDISDTLKLQNVISGDDKSQVKAYLSSERAGPWLLIIDNADDAEIWMSAKGPVPALKTFLPRSQNGFTVFTTRNQQLANSLVGRDIIKIPELNDKLAIDLLRASLVEENLMKDDTSTITLIHQLGGLPLALIQATSYINQNSITLNEYVMLLNEQESIKVELLSQDFEDDYRYEDIQNPVAATWLISFEQIRRSNLLAAEYLSHIACVDPRDIPLSFLPQKGSLIDQQKAMGLLKAYSFITEMANSRFINMHRLVHLATRSWLRSEKLLEHWTIKTGELLSEVFPSDEYDNRILWRGYLPHALFILQSQEYPKDNLERESLSQRVAQCLYADGRYNEAEAPFKEVFERRTQRLKKEDPEIFESMANLASTYRDQGRWNKAEELFVQVLNFRKTVLGPEHPSTLTSMADLASIYRNQGRWKEAEELDRKVMDTRKTVLGPKNPDTLNSMANLAITYRNQGRWKEAEELFVQVLNIRKTVLGPEHPSTLTSMADLASSFWNQSRWNEAEELFVQVLDMRKIVLGPEHPDTLASMANLASTYRNQGRSKEAEELDVKVVDTWKKLLGPEHPDTLTTMANLACTYSSQGRWKEAEELDRKVMDTRKTVLGPEHPSTLTSMANLASTYRDQGRWKEAEELEVQVVDTWKTLLGPEHPDTLTTMANLAITYSNQGRWKEAEELDRKVMDTRKTVLGPKNPDTLNSMANLAITYRNQGRWKEAEELFVQVLNIRKTVLGPKHPDTLASMANLAIIYRNQGRWKEAKELFVQVLDIRKIVLGPQHPDTLTSLANLASIYRNQSQWKEAEELDVKVMDIRKIVLGPEHPGTLTSMANLAITYRSQGRWKEAEELEVQVLDIRKTVMGPEHPDTLTSMWSLAYTIKDQGRHAEGLALLEACVLLRGKSLGQTHPDTIRALSDLELWRKALLNQSHIASDQSAPQLHPTVTIDSPDKTMICDNLLQTHIRPHLLLQNGLPSTFPSLFPALQISHQPVQTTNEDKDEVD
ncbi:kinesin light chain 1 and, putative [Talaromyces stipitatus ATCC 10500]|uniref:Kinesin light chain 1 and, putative n=1 Tax=Talaromyces stipitatus (strain ATCC 10500 / CBS 375.48 / QM 6759 / NRRL 1006) TaxID=441959 RepID=B8M8W6_TALSN|nr:kinesin light chain 1 and, putative [Talaromyces stipitatus ATCC 10500]EED20629.1 kinesin light chain 1 and, putative [Talaromyces stipitatus ATCC 10500]